MRLLARPAFTLIELLVALSVLGILMGSLGRILITTQRSSFASAQRVALRQGLRAVATILPAEFRELDAADSDITAMSTSAITIRAMRQLAVLCRAPEGDGPGLSIIVRQQPFYGARQAFAIGDSVLVYVEGDGATRADDAWVPGVVAEGSGEDCPDPDWPRPGERLGVRLRGMADTAGEVRRGITNGSPVRGFATVTYASYRSPTDRQWYLGQRLAGAAIQPLMGPLVGPDGLSLAYFDGTGVPTAAPTDVAEIELRVRAHTALPIRGPNGETVYQDDSVITRVALRNNPRCRGCP